MPADQFVDLGRVVKRLDRRHELALSLQRDAKVVVQVRRDGPGRKIGDNVQSLPGERDRLGQPTGSPRFDPESGIGPGKLISGAFAQLQIGGVLAKPPSNVRP